MTGTPDGSARSGVLLGVAAYGLWGLFPLFWKALEAATAREILAHRMVWSMVFVALLLVIRREWSWIRAVIESPRILFRFLVTASLLTVNWLTYIWGVNNGHIVETSLGYFINPLLYVALGMIFLRERLRRGQAVAIALALVAVIGLTIHEGVPPWIALVLALTFGTYGLLRKTAPLRALPGFSLETAILFIPALAYLVLLESSGEATFGHGPAGLSFGLGLSGVITAVPLILFAAAARRVTLTTIGLLQYIAPTGQFLLGVLVFGERLDGWSLGCYVLIWIALAVYSAEGIRHSRAPTS